MVNPYEPTAHASNQPSDWRSDWRFAAVTFIFIACLLIAITDPISLFIPATRPWLRPRFGFSTIFINPLIFLSIWYRQRDSGTLRGAVFMLLALGVINGSMLVWKGTVSQVTNPFQDSLHSAWLWTVLPPLLFAAMLVLVDPLLLGSPSRDKPK